MGVTITRPAEKQGGTPINVLWACHWDPKGVQEKLPHADITDIALVDQRKGKQLRGDTLMQEFKTGLDLVKPDVVVFGLWSEQWDEQKDLIFEARIHNPDMKIIVASGERGASDFFFDESQQQSKTRGFRSLDDVKEEFIVESLRQVMQGKETA